MRSSLAAAARRSLIGSNVALMAHAPRAQPRARCGPETWTASHLRWYLASAAHLRLFPALQGSEREEPKRICDCSVTVGELARVVQAWPSSSLISSRRRRALTPAGQPA
jgi:hypothetical protein